MDTIALDTTRFIAGGAAAVADAVTECHVRSREAYARAIRRLWRFYSRRKGGKRGSNRPLAHIRSLRDNYGYRASFAFPNRPRNPASGDPPVTTVDNYPQSARRRAGRPETSPCRR